VGILGFLFFLFLKSKFLLFSSQNMQIYLNLLVLLLLHNDHHSNVWDNLRALLGLIFESSVPCNLKT